MFSTLRNRFGIPGVISVIALVFAMLGGAYAATNSSSGKSATASAKKKAAKGPRGPKGATGPTGPTGAAGAAGGKGDTGAAGSNGEKGANGSAGTAGANGKTVLNGTGAPTSGTGTVGDFYIDTSAQEIYGPKAASGANGGWGTGTLLKGEDGEDGEPWVVGQAPSGAVLRGTWAAYSPNAADDEQIPVVFSTGVPVGSLSALSIVPFGGGDPLADLGFGCDGEYENPTPAAVPGVICAYTSTSGATNLAPWTIQDVFNNLNKTNKGGGFVALPRADNAGPVNAVGVWVLVVP